MGWTYLQKSPSETVEHFLAQRFHYEDEEGLAHVLDCVVVKLNTAYLAIRYFNKCEGEEEIKAMVCLLDYSEENDDFGYKAIAEECGPLRYEAPEQIMRLLTPITSQWALQWRANCWKRIQGVAQNLDKRAGRQNENDCIEKYPVWLVSQYEK